MQLRAKSIYKLHTGFIAWQHPHLSGCLLGARALFGTSMSSMSFPTAMYHIGPHIHEQNVSFQLPISWGFQGHEHHCNCAHRLCDHRAGGWLGAEEKPVNIVFGYIGYMKVHLQYVPVTSPHILKG